MCNDQYDVPLISVIMGILNKKENIFFIKKSIHSILNQTFVDFELLVCDDGSDPEVIHLLDELSQVDCRIHLVRDPNKITLSEKLNFCLQHAKGEFVARMDDDDFSHPTRLERQYNFLLINKDISFVGCNVNQIFSKNKSFSRLLPESPTLRDFLFVLPFIHPTLLFRREVLTLVGGYSEEVWCERCEDYELMFRLYENSYYGYNLEEILFDYSTNFRGNRLLKHRLNESKTRYIHFKKNGFLPKYIFYVIKPLLVCIVPTFILVLLKRIYYKK